MQKTAPRFSLLPAVAGLLLLLLTAPDAAAQRSIAQNNQTDWSFVHRLLPGQTAGLKMNSKEIKGIIEIRSLNGEIIFKRRKDDDMSLGSWSRATGLSTRFRSGYEGSIEISIYSMGSDTESEQAEGKYVVARVVGRAKLKNPSLKRLRTRTEMVDGEEVAVETLTLVHQGIEVD